MSQNPQNAAAASAVNSNLHTKVRVKIEQIARLRMQGLKDAQIMPIVGLSQGGFSRIVALQEFKDTEEAILAGHVTKLDEDLADNREALKLAYRSAVPAAMRTLLEAVVQRRDMKLAVTASEAVLDRDPERTFAKAGRGMSDSAQQTQGQLPSALLASVSAEADKVAKGLESKGPVVFAAPRKDVN